MGTRLKEGQAVWVKDAAVAKEDLYNVGHVVSIEADGKKATVECNNGGKSQTKTVPVEECFHVNVGKDTPDHCQLVYLNEPTLLENTRKRFASDKIYTYVGDILVAVNPFKWIDGIYAESNMELCKGKRLYNAACGPHVFAISEKAFVTMQKKKKSQCIVVSGESGAGKTETNRQLMNYLVWRGRAEGSTGKSELTQKILDTNPILEAFGNAKTTRNNNSSRFGRYVLVQFSQGVVLGARVLVFLLERSRVTSAGNAGERSYHALYMLVSSGRHGLDTNPKSHRYLSLSGTETVPGFDDRKEFDQLDAAFLSVGYLAEEMDDMWGFVAAMLYLGNVEFGQGDEAEVGNPDVVTKVEGLLGLSNLKLLLETRKLKVGTEVTTVKHSPQQAQLARDSLVKIMYARLFDALVVRINGAIDKSREAELYIGLLDVYGFEFFAVNSFEQLCINFANEKLQQFFLITVFSSEEATYKEDGIPWQPVPYADNKEIISLIESPGTGVYATLDSACKTPSATGATFCGQLHQQHAKSKVLSAPKVSKKENRSRDNHFVVKHFAGDVVYCADEFLEKNNDSLSPEIEEALIGSAKPLVAQICTPEEPPAPAKGKKGSGSFGSVGAKFVKSLKGLMDQLGASEAHFVRCIKPNPQLKPGLIHGESVVDQLRMSGTLDAIKLIQSGFPTRIPYEALHTNYKDIMPPNVAALPPTEFCEVIAEVVGIGKNEYALGLQRMFFKLGAAAFLEELQDADPEAMKPLLLAKLAQFEKKKSAKPIIEKNLLMWIQKRRYRVVIAEERRRLAELRRIEEEKQRKIDEANARAEEERRRQEEAENRRKEEEAARQRALDGEKELEEQKSEFERKEEAVAVQKEVEKVTQSLVEADEMVHQLEEKVAQGEEADLHEAVTMLGGVKGVVAMSVNHKPSPQVQAQFAGLLRDLCVSDEIATEIAAAGGVEALVEAAHRHYDDPDVVLEVSDALRNLSHGDDVSLAVAKAGGIEVLVDGTARHKSDVKVIAAIAGALWGLSVHDEIVPKLIQLGGAHALLSASEAHLGEAEVQASVAAALRNLAVDENMQCAISEMGGVNCLVQAAETHAADSSVQAHVAAAIWNLSRTPSVAVTIASSNAIPVVVAAATAFPENAEVQMNVAGALRHLAVTDEYADQIVQVGGLPAIFAMASSHAADAEVQGAVAGALWELSRHGFDGLIYDAGGVEIVLRIGERHVKSDRICARVAGVLRLLSIDSERKVAIGEQRGVEALVKMAAAHPKSAAVDVAGALSNLAVDDDLELAIGAAGGIQSLLDALANHDGRVTLMADIWHALANLSFHVDNKRRMVNSKGFRNLLTTSIEKHGEAANVVHGIADTMRNLASLDDGEAITSIADVTIVKALVEALAREPANVIIAMAVASAFANLMVSLPLRQRILATEPLKAAAQAALQAGLEAHKDDEALQGETARALRFLDGGAPVAPPVIAESPAAAGGEEADKVVAKPETAREGTKRRGGGMTNRVLGGVAGMFSNRAKMSNPLGPAPKKRGDASERQGTARRMLSRRKPKAEHKMPDAVVQAV